MSKTSEYIEEYKDYACQQMKRYGIPASVTLAQGILESSNGQSQLSQECNNHFGMKAGKAWIQNGGQYRLFDDDKPNEKFCLYASVADSYEHHSKVLANSDRYKACFKLAPDDYKGWTAGLQNGGYATNKKYAASLNNVIEKCHLDQYDKQVMAEMKQEEKKFGVADNPLQTSSKQSQSSSATANSSTSSASATAAKQESNTGFVLDDGNYSMPIKRSEFLLVTSPYGNRKDPMDHTKTQFHRGIDIKAKGDDLLATENNGKVITANNNVNTGGGKTVVVEYTRNNGSKTQCVYMHMSKINVKVGDTVNAGDKLGVSGNTGTRTTGEHLHFGVRTVDKDGKQEYVNPAAYLAEINAHGKLNMQTMYNGKDLLASYTASNGQKNEEVNLSSDDWMKKLLSSEDSGMNMDENNGGGLLQMAFTIFSSLIAMASQVEEKTEQEKMQTITEAVTNKSINLTSMTPSLKSCTLNVLDNGKMVLQIDTGKSKTTHELTNEEVNKLSTVLNSNADDNTKSQKISNIVNGIVLSQQSSMNYEQLSEQQNQQNIQRR